jgi:Ni/Fe-hydrogenase subunit HybB-like protein
MNGLISFIKAIVTVFFIGSKRFYCWMSILTAILAFGIYCYSLQITEGLAVTGLTDQVSWGLYISNFTFFVGIAAAAVMLVIPLYVFGDKKFTHAVLIGEAVAISSLIMCILYVVVDMGRPDRLWHMIPHLGYFNWPQSLLAWDVVVLNGYLFLNIFILFYLLFKRYMGQKPNKRVYIPIVFLSILWAVGIHTVTAFLYAGIKAKPFWNSSILGPRFIASAFTAGPAIIILLLSLINQYTYARFKEKVSTYYIYVKPQVLKKLALIVTTAAQINLFLLFCEIFKEFYSDSHHSLSAKYLFFGLDGHYALVPWIWTSIVLNVGATLTLTVHKLRNKKIVLYVCSFILFIAIWIEKGLGLIIPGFIPSPMGQIVEYTPTFVEIGVSLGILSVGLMIFTCITRVIVPILVGKLRYEGLSNQVD